MKASTTNWANIQQNIVYFPFFEESLSLSLSFSLLIFEALTKFSIFHSFKISIWLTKMIVRALGIRIVAVLPLIQLLCNKALYFSCFLSIVKFQFQCCLFLSYAVMQIDVKRVEKSNIFYLFLKYRKSAIMQIEFHQIEDIFLGSL